ncbi:glycerophosphodiester phosphodiesterase [Sphingomonas sinipercae]|uniref:Glycerophosphodiester phosphodiesterase n=1 Tax=Sphingomonas sinipercae TaxID=2714944 RepID=A0A6G7ZQ95_9SPHN|nr:glycerophosphodiester phosphodiesterase family protein [Sphingomonas sinipercae]QIL03113.1 glycerophosphodiester phosphodiesterase [Sphingomonas sinipercae]
MLRWLKLAAFALAILLLVLTFINASWLASAQRGQVRLIAHRGVAQLYDHKGVGRDSCTATRIEQPVHDYLENTTRSLAAAPNLGADMVEIDIAPTADGKIAVFHDWTLDCRTNGKGNIRDATMAQLQALDPGHGYTADGGKTFPFRGQQKDRIPTLEQALAAAPKTPIMFNFKSKDAGEADLLAAALRANGRAVEAIGDGFYGAPGPVERIKHHFPKAWAWSKESAGACTKQYLVQGWLTIVPESCRNGTLIVPLNYQWAFAGWPDRTLARMKDVGAHVLLVGPRGKDRPMGLTLPEQLGDIPNSFKGHVWVEDIWTVGPALKPKWDFRSNPQRDAAEAGLERRRKHTSD